jgi:uncharacterized protein (DUF1778 family)
MAALTKTPKIERLEARVSSEQKELLRRAAMLEGRSLTDFITASAAKEARRVLREHREIQLSARDSKFFAATILTPPKPNDRLRAAAQRYKKA